MPNVKKLAVLLCFYWPDHKLSETNQFLILIFEEFDIVITLYTTIQQESLAVLKFDESEDFGEKSLANEQNSQKIINCNY